MIFVGIDLGQHGGIAWIDDTLIPTSIGTHITLPELRPMPEDIKEKFEILQGIATTCHKGERQYEKCILTMEDIQIYTNQNINVEAYQSLYQEMGMFHAWGYILGMEIKKVHPRTWQNKMNCLPLQGKQKAKAMAGQNLEEAKGWDREYGSKGLALREAKKRFLGVNLIAPGGKVPHDGIIDALLIAEYSRREYQHVASIS